MFRRPLLQHHARTFGAFALCAAAFFAPSSARADRLSQDESVRLVRGDTVAREQTLERGDKRYVGGVAYTLLDASDRELDALFDDVSAYQRVLPRTKSAQVVGHKDGDVLVELRQGTSLFETTYTIRVRREPRKGTVRFWLDPSRPHGIEDAWGFFRAERTGDGRVLVTFGALVDMGDGLGRALFEERVRHAMLTVPDRLRGYLAEVRAREPRRYSQLDRR
jgi:ribosome-associated toxin RatA of RatAB toxin-antitoxin module